MKLKDDLQVVCDIPLNPISPYSESGDSIYDLTSLDEGLTRDIGLPRYHAIRRFVKYPPGQVRRRTPSGELLPLNFKRTALGYISKTRGELGQCGSDSACDCEGRPQRRHRRIPSRLRLRVLAKYSSLPRSLCRISY